MRMNTRFWLISLALVVMLASAEGNSQPQLVGPPGAPAKVALALHTVTSGLVGVAGVAAQDMATGAQIFLNADEPFPMASTYKIAIAMTLLAKVDHGELNLTDMVDIDDSEWVYSQVIAANFIHRGVSLSIANLLEVMITQSDNTATDICLRLAGGPSAVNQYLGQLGIDGMRVDRSTADLLRDFYGIEPGRENLGTIARIAAADPNKAIAANPEFEADPLDKSTPRAMLNLLTTLSSGQALSDDSTRLLMDTMMRTVTMPGRLSALLPKNTPIAHKTGTVGGVANDVGYITLPNGRRFAIAVFTRGSKTPPSDRERAIAEVARTLYDYFSFL